MIDKVTKTYPAYRWVILLLVFLATALNYVDRIVLGVTANEIKQDFCINDLQYGYILTAFSTLYAVGFLVAGMVIDKFGTKLGYLLSIIAWSLSGAMTGLSGSALSLGFWRGLLGITESGNFPAAIKAVAEWFPTSQRALATALFNSGPHIALVAGPPLIAALTLSAGWRMSFIVLGLAGLPLSIVWYRFYKEPDHLKQEYAQNTKVSNTSIRWRDILQEKSTWGILIGKFCTDPVWWFYIFWLPPFLFERHGFNITQIGWAMPVVYALAIVISNLAGWYTGYLIKQGWSDFRSRKWVMFLCAMCLPVTGLAVFASSPWAAIVLIALAAGAHSGWSANIFTLVSDAFPSRSVGSVTGLAGFAGGLGGILISSLAPGFIIAYFGYIPIFVLMGLLHPFAFLCIFFLVRKQKSQSI